MILKTQENATKKKMKGLVPEKMVIFFAPNPTFELGKHRFSQENKTVETGATNFPPPVP